jgi:hypothetical protein
VFFFEKKSQKTSIHYFSGVAADSVQVNKSLFASFSSEKEDPSLPSPHLPQAAPFRPSRRARRAVPWAQGNAARSLE